MINFLPRVLLTATTFFAITFINAQYCTPAITSASVHIARVGFGPPFGNIPGGLVHNSGGVFGSELYVDRSTPSSATVNKGCAQSYDYALQICFNPGAKNFNFRLYADWNQDNDFDDSGEIVTDVNGTIPNGSCYLLPGTIILAVPFTANSGVIRMRWAVRDGGNAGAPALACGGYPGEIEDYSITVATNIAPVLDAGGTPLLNDLVETQITNNGLEVGRVMNTTLPGVTLITEANACQSKGFALTASNGTGVWQFTTPSGSWTDMGILSASNALLLGATDRIRFVPAGTGTAGISFKAWDGTSGTNGTYYAITTTGGTSAFSDVTETASLEVVSAASAAADLPIYLSPYGGATNDNNIAQASITPGTGVAKHPEPVTTDNLSGFGYDLEYNTTDNKLYWAGGADFISILSSNADGTDMNSLLTGFGFPTGLAVSPTQLFVIDYGMGITAADLDGSNAVMITGGAGQATDIGATNDIEYYNGKIYYINQPGGAGAYKLFEANTDGTGTAELYSFTSYPYGLDIANGNIYWTENDGVDAFINSIPIGGGAVTQLVTAPGRYFYGLMVNPANNTIYFTDVPASGNDAYLKSIPIAGGAITHELVLDFDYFGVAFNRITGTLPVNFISVKAWAYESYNKIEWKVAEEDNVSHYIVERSSDGTLFNDAGIVSAAGKESYQWVDPTPVTGKNFYRVRSVDNDGKQLFSTIVWADNNNINRGISITPTILRNSQFNLRIQNMPAGNYKLQVINGMGQAVLLKNIPHAGGSVMQTVSMPVAGKGLYRVIVSGEKQVYRTVIVVD